jgi:hypothetical protein
MPHLRARLAAIAVSLGTVAAIGPMPALAATGPGWLDATFGSGGFVAVPHSGAARDRCGIVIGLTRAPTGRIFVGADYCGTDDLLNPSEAAAFTPAGHIDRAFNAGRPRRVTAGDGAGLPFMGQLFATGSGGLIARISDPPGACDVLARFTPSGARDASYGRACLPAPDFYQGGRATQLPGGSMRMCIASMDGPGSPRVLSGLTQTGIIDQRIGPDGYRIIPLPFDCLAFTSDAAGRLYWISRRWLPDGRPGRPASCSSPTSATGWSCPPAGTDPGP